MKFDTVYSNKLSHFDGAGSVRPYSTREVETARVAGMSVIIYQTKNEITIFRLEERAGKFFGNFDTVYQVTRLLFPGKYNRKE